MAKKNNLEEIKRLIDASGLSESEAMDAIRASLFVNRSSCAEASCTYNCYSCKDGCANGPTGK